MTYTTLCTNIDLDLEISFDVTPSYPATRIDPEEPATAEIRQVWVSLPGGKRVVCPDWLFDLMDPDNWQDELVGNAQAAAYNDACDAADYRYEMRQEAAE